MNDLWHELQPDEQAFKMELESLANQIQPSPEFVAELEKKLATQVQIQSISKPPQRSKILGFTPMIAIAASLLITLFCLIGLLSAVVLSSNDGCNENCLLATPISATNQAISQHISGSETAQSIEGTQIAFAGTPDISATNNYALANIYTATMIATFPPPTNLPSDPNSGIILAGTATAPSFVVPLATAGAANVDPNAPNLPNVGVNAIMPTVTPLATIAARATQFVQPAGTITIVPPFQTAISLPATFESTEVAILFPTATPSPQPTATVTATSFPESTAITTIQPSATYAPPSSTPIPTRDIATPIPNIAPEDMPPDMFFANYGVNPFLDTEDDPLSTFALDVDSASYTLARSYLLNVGSLPPTDAIRSEEFVNYFDMDYPSPEEDAFGIYLTAAPAPFGYDGHYLMQVGIQGKTIEAEDRDPLLLILVIDVSGSMGDGGRLELVKRSLALLLDELRPDDRIGIVTYTDTASVLLDPVAVSEKDRILGIINGLTPLNSTNVEDGLRLGYDMAETYRLFGEQTRVILLSDGVANVGLVNPDDILGRIQNGVENQITLSSIGVGMGNYNDVLMEQLADNGDGNYYYVDTLREAQRVLSENLLGTLTVVAYDAKVQVEFNPEIADRYRLIGYENRAVADSDFRNDAVDAGEVGSVQSATALYEMALENGDVNGVIATVYVRYQDAETGQIVELSREIRTTDLIRNESDLPPNFRLAASTAEFSELLRDSYWAEDGSYADLLMFAQPLESLYANEPEVQEFLELIRLAGRLVDQ